MPTETETATPVRAQFPRARPRRLRRNETLRRLVRAHVTRGRAGLDPLQAHVTQLSPLKILDRGYAIVTNESGQIVKSPADALSGTTIHARLAKGKIAGRVVDTATGR